MSHKVCVQPEDLCTATKEPGCTILPFRASVCSFSVEISQTESLDLHNNKGSEFPTPMLRDSLLDVPVVMNRFHGHKQAEKGEDLCQHTVDQ